MAACSDDEVLFAIHTKGHRCSVPACRKLCLPKFFSGLDIEGANIGIKRAGDKRQPGSGDDQDRKRTLEGTTSCKRERYTDDL